MGNGKKKDSKKELSREARKGKLFHKKLNKERKKAGARRAVSVKIKKEPPSKGSRAERGRRSSRDFLPGAEKKKKDLGGEDTFKKKKGGKMRMHQLQGRRGTFQKKKNQKEKDFTPRTSLADKGCMINAKGREAKTEKEISTPKPVSEILRS